MAAQQTRLDRLINWFSPQWGAERFAARAAQDLLLSYRGSISTRSTTPYGASTSANGVRLPKAEDARKMRDRARNLERNNALAAGVLDRAVENIVGTGIRIEPRTGDESFDGQVRERWADWCRACDVRRQHSFEQMQALLVRSELRDGDVGCLLSEISGEPKLQPIEGDYISSPAGKYSGGMMVDGVELNPAGAATAFWIKSIDQSQKTTWVRVPDRDFVFLAECNTFTQVRGVSKFAQSFWLFDNIEGYLEGTVTAARAASYFSLLIKKHNAGKAFASLGTITNSNAESQQHLRLEPGSVQYLAPDEDVVQISPQQPTQNFPDAIAAISRFIGLPFGLTIEQVLLDFSRANYSSSRAARLQAQQTAEIYQQRFATRFVSRVYQWVLSKWVNRGLIGGAIPERFWAHEWIPQGRPWVDPTKDMQAALMAIDAGLESRSNIALERGYDFRELIRRSAADRQLMTAAGVPVVASTMTRAPEPGAAPQPDADNEEEEDDETQSNDTDGTDDRDAA